MESLNTGAINTNSMVHLSQLLEVDSSYERVLLEDSFRETSIDAVFGFSANGKNFLYGECDAEGFSIFDDQGDLVSFSDGEDIKDKQLYEFEKTVDSTISRVYNLEYSTSYNFTDSEIEEVLDFLGLDENGKEYKAAKELLLNKGSCLVADTENNIYLLAVESSAAQDLLKVNMYFKHVDPKSVDEVKMKLDYNIFEKSISADEFAEGLKTGVNTVERDVAEEDFLADCNIVADKPSCDVKLDEKSSISTKTSDEALSSINHTEKLPLKKQNKKADSLSFWAWLLAIFKQKAESFAKIHGFGYTLLSIKSK